MIRRGINSATTPTELGMSKEFYPTVFSINPLIRAVFSGRVVAKGASS